MSSWRDLRLKDLCTDAGQYGLNVSAESYVPHGVRLLRTTDISSGRLTDADSGVYVDGVPEERFTLAAGDLLLSRSGTPPGQSYLVRDADAGMTFAGYLVRFRPRPDVDARFIAYVARSAPFQHTIHAESVSSTIQNFNAERYANMRFAVSDSTQQRRIADFLDAETARIDQLAAAMRTQDDLLKDRRLRLLDSVRGTAQNYVPLARLGYFSALITSGSRGWSEYLSDTGELFFRSANLHSDRIQPKLANVAHVQLPESEAAESQRARIQVGDCLVGITGANAGWVCLADESVAHGYVSQHVCLVRPQPHQIDGHWLALLIASPYVQSELMGSQYGGTKTQLSLPDVRAIRVPVLPFNRQVQLAQSVNRQTELVDRQRALRQQQLTLLAERRQALITAAVTGQFDVSTASGRNVTEGVSV